MKVLLIDGNSMLFRAYFATAYGRPLSTSSGIPTNAVYGFASMLTKALELISPDSVVVAFDHDKDNFRREVYTEYKGTRQKTPDNLVAQFPIVREYIDAIHMTQYEAHGIEADDIIGSLAKQNSDYDINILTSDKDLLQLVDPNIKVWLMVKGITEMECMTEQAVYDRFTLKPLQIIDLKGLSGDPSDNIPGVTKVGDKTAIDLLNRFGTVEGVYEHIDELKGKLKENLINDHDKAIISKWLATIKTDAQIDIDLHQCGYDLQNPDAQAFYSKYEMHSLLEVPVNRRETKETRNIEPTVVSRLPESLLAKTVSLWLDGEKQDISGIAIADDADAYYITSSDALNCNVFKNLVEGKQLKIVYDIKRWYHFLSDSGFKLNNATDMMIAAFLLDTKQKTISDLAVKYHFNISDSSSKNAQVDLFGDEQFNSQYSCEVAAGLLECYKPIMKELEEKGMLKLYEDLELPLAEVLYAMEKQGIRVNAEVLDTIAAQTQEKLDVLEKSIYALAGKQFNINSPKQLAEIIYDDLALMKSKKRSTDVSVLKKIENRHPIIPEVLEYRKYSKLNSTYAVGLKKYIQSDNKIHTEYNQCITETGRLSSSNPNLQNISVRNEESQVLRTAFIPDEGCLFVGADYSQVELRILAHMADEKALIEAFKAGMDIHTKTAMDVFNVAENEVTPLMRRHAKAINFGIDYGMSDFGLAEQLDIPVPEARRFIEKYFSEYPNVKAYMNRTVAECQEKGYVTTMLNRRREIPEINSSNYSLREFGKRAAMNTPVQGSAADLIKIAMLNVYRRLKKENLKSSMVLQIHDELILNVPAEEKDIVMKLVEEEMENAMELKVPLLAEAESGNNWLEVK